MPTYFMKDVNNKYTNGESKNQPITITMFKKCLPLNVSQFPQKQICSVELNDGKEGFVAVNFQSKLIGESPIIVKHCNPNEEICQLED